MKLLKRLKRWFAQAGRDAPRHVSTAPIGAPGANRYFYLGPDLALVRLNSGQLLYVDPLDEHVSANIIAHGYWEAWVHAVVTSLLKPGDHVVEIGANVGYYTVTMADRIGPKGVLTSFEANPRLVALVNRSLTLNGFAARARLVAKAAMDRAGQVEFVVSRRNSGGGYVSQWEHQPYEDGEKLQIEAIPLDDLNLAPVDFIRIDAEGSEPFILRGAEALIDRSPDVVICMEWSVIQMASRTSVPDFVDWLVAKGFRFWRIDYDASLSSIDAAQLAEIGNCDIVAARRPLPSRPSAD